MARFFKFKSLNELEATAAGLDLDLRFSSDFSVLFQPITVGPLRVGNRLCVQPMEGCDATIGGQADELTLRRYRRFGAGGAKMIWFEAAAVVPEGRANPRQLLMTEENLPALARCVTECRAHHRAAFDDGDLVMGLQLTHSGRYSHATPLRANADPLLDLRLTRTGPLMSDADLEALPDAYANAARLAARAGFQYIDVKQCHRYLLNELLSARSRPGLFGGSLENRTRLARSIFQAVRSAAPALILATRLNVYDGVPYHRDPTTGVGVPDTIRGPVTEAWGTNASEPHQADIVEPLCWIAEMRGLGVQLVNISLGNPYASPHLLRPFEYPPPDGYETPEHPLIGVDRHFRLTQAVQDQFPDLAIVGSGYSYLQEFVMHAAAANIRDCRCTFAGLGRATLAQPDFVKQIMDTGRLDRKRVCRTFSYCTALMRSKNHPLGQFPAGCPPFDREGYGEVWQQALAVRERQQERDSKNERS